MCFAVTTCSTIRLPVPTSLKIIIVGVARPRKTRIRRCANACQTPCELRTMHAVRNADRTSIAFARSILAAPAGLRGALRQLLNLLQHRYPEAAVRADLKATAVLFSITTSLICNWSALTGTGWARRGSRCNEGAGAALRLLHLWGVAGRTEAPWQLQ
jgi:hypothetical protein